MQDLRVIGTEDGALLVSDDDGTRYRLPVDDVLQVKLRQVTPDPSIGARLAPRDIQAYIRSGMSAEDVATITGAPLDHIQKFEGPVLAEREFVVTSALSVPVHTALETDPLAQGVTFGMAIRSRLVDLGATSERWASWKDAATGWIVKLSFTAEQINHDARWHFDPKKQALDPLNNEATTLSQQGDLTGSLIPRLRAVHQDDRAQDASRFDSGAFDLGEADAPEARAPICSMLFVAVAASVRPRPMRKRRSKILPRHSPRRHQASESWMSRSTHPPRTRRSVGRPGHSHPFATPVDSRAFVRAEPRCPAGTRSSSARVPTTTWPNSPTWLNSLCCCGPG